MGPEGTRELTLQARRRAASAEQSIQVGDAELAREFASAAAHVGFQVLRGMGRRYAGGRMMPCLKCLDTASAAEGVNDARHPLRVPHRPSMAGGRS